MEKQVITPSQWGLSVVGQVSDAIRMAVEQMETLLKENTELKAKIAEMQKTMECDGK